MLFNQKYEYANIILMIKSKSIGYNLMKKHIRKIYITNNSVIMNFFNE